ncbi:MAG: hypothetical protein ACRDON_01840 [Gaiellaceae bacterium]
MLLFVAGVDALRSSDSETSAPTTTASTTTASTGAPTTVVETPDTPLPFCTPRQIAVSIEVPKGVPVIVVRHIGGTPCHLGEKDPGLRLTIRDRGGNQVGFLPDQRVFPSAWTLDFEGDLAASRWTFPLPFARRCPWPGPFLALATVGPYSARRGNLSRSEIACDGGGGTQESAKRLRAEYIAQAQSICSTATARFETAADPYGEELENIAAWSEAAARFSEEAITRLRALPPPEADRARVKQVLSFMALQPDLFRQLAAAASAGDAARARMLSDELRHLTHQKDGLVYRLASLWRVHPLALFQCPLNLPA